MTSASGLLIGGDISTSGDQEYAGAVGLVEDTTLSSAGNIQFESTVDGGHALAVCAGGTVGFGGAVGPYVALAAPSVSAASCVAPALGGGGNLSVAPSCGRH